MDVIVPAAYTYAGRAVGLAQGLVFALSQAKQALLSRAKDGTNNTAAEPPSSEQLQSPGKKQRLRSPSPEPEHEQTKDQRAEPEGQPAGSEQFTQEEKQPAEPKQPQQQTQPISEAKAAPDMAPAPDKRIVSDADPTPAEASEKPAHGKAADKTNGVTKLGDLTGVTQPDTHADYAAAAAQPAAPDADVVDKGDASTDGSHEDQHSTATHASAPDTAASQGHSTANKKKNHSRNKKRGRAHK